MFDIDIERSVVWIAIMIIVFAILGFVSVGLSLLLFKVFGIKLTNDIIQVMICVIVVVVYYKKKM